MKKLMLRFCTALLLCCSICLPRPGYSQLSGIITVGPGGTYPSLTGPGGFFETLNANIVGLNGYTELRITGNLCETGLNMLNGLKLYSNTMKIIPNPGAPLPVVISNCADINQSLLRLDGVENITISNLTLVNTNTTFNSAKPVLEFINNSTNVILENNTFRGNDPSTVEGTLMMGSGVHTNAIIRNNIFGDAIGGSITNMPGNAIYANNATNRLQIINNTISNNTNYGIFLNTGNGTVVDGNRICQAVTKTTPGGGINVSGGGNLTITHNIIGNGDPLGGGTWMQNAGDFYGIYAMPNTFAPDPLSTSNISDNIVEDVAFNSPGTPVFSGIFGQQGSINFNNNTIRNITCNANGFVHCFLLSPVNGSNYSVTGNTLSGITNNSTGSISRTVGMRNQGGGNFVMHIINNSFTNFQTFSTNPSATSPGLAAFEIASSSGAYEIYFNEFKEIYNPGLSPTTVTGINTNTFPNTIDIQRNKIFDLRNAGSAGSTIFGMNLQGGSGQVINNYIGINNYGNTNDVSVTGINFGGSSSSVYNAYFNTVLLNTNINSGTSSTACIRRPSSANFNLLNNALVNYCQGGTGNHTAIANTRSSSTAIGFNGSNYNFLSTRNPNIVCIWNTSTQSFTAWQTISQKDYNSLTADPGNFDAQVFGDLLTGEIILDPNNPDIWYFKGNGMPVPGINTDLLGNPGTRPDNVTAGPPSIGAYEVGQTTVAPRNMTITGITAPGATQDFSFGGQRFFSIQWGAGGTVPTVNYIRRFPIAPPGFNGSNPGNRSLFNYFDVNITGGSGYSANVTLFWFPNADGRINPIANAVMGKKETVGAWTLPPGSTFITGPSPYNWEAVTANIGQFSLFTAVDPASTLPVNLLSFKAQKKNNDVLLFWSTAGETDHDHFEVERSTDGIQFSPLAMVSGNNTSTPEKNYTCTDTRALLIATGKLYYRLKIVSRSGNNAYSNIIQVPLSVLQQEWSWKFSPNPFRDKIAVNLYLAENGLLEFNLYSMTGELLRKKTVIGEKGYSTIEMSGLERLLKGTYIIQLKKDGQVMTEKMVKL